MTPPGTARRISCLDVLCFYFGKNEFKYLGEKFMMSVSAIKTNVISKEIRCVTDRKHSSICHLFLVLCIFCLPSLN